jgi:redox-sensitive bicupin YhaK (pirin superfamily)
MHSETPVVDPVTNRTKGIQLWVALPESHLNDKPQYKDIRSAKCPVSTPIPGCSVKIIAGDSFGASAPILTRTPVWYFDITLAGKTTPFTHPIPKEWGTFAHVLEGNPHVAGVEARPHETFFMNRDGEGVEIENKSREPARLLLIAGNPLDGQQVHRMGPFVSASRNGIQSAIIDFRAGTNGFEKASRWSSD